MKFMVEFRLKAGSKNRVVDVFDIRGPNRSPQVTFRGAWLCARSDMAFVLSESTDESFVAKACQFWEEYGSYQIHPVIDVEDF